jgi:hypothetical protein
MMWPLGCFAALAMTGWSGAPPYLRHFPPPPAFGRASPPPQLCGPMSASVGFLARLAGMFAARPNGRSPASRRFDGGDGKMTGFFFSETAISARFEILAIWIAAQ